MQKPVVFNWQSTQVLEAGGRVMKVKTCPSCGERWWCVKCGICHWCYPDLEPPAGVAVKPRGGSPSLPSRAVNLL